MVCFFIYVKSITHTHAAVIAKAELDFVLCCADVVFNREICRLSTQQLFFELITDLSAGVAFICNGRVNPTEIWSDN